MDSQKETKLSTKLQNSPNPSPKPKEKKSSKSNSRNSTPRKRSKHRSRDDVGESNKITNYFSKQNDLKQTVKSTEKDWKSEKVKSRKVEDKESKSEKIINRKYKDKESKSEKVKNRTDEDKKSKSEKVKNSTDEDKKSKSEKIKNRKDEDKESKSEKVKNSTDEDKKSKSEKTKNRKDKNKESTSEKVKNRKDEDKESKSGKVKSRRDDKESKSEKVKNRKDEDKESKSEKDTNRKDEDTKRSSKSSKMSKRKQEEDNVTKKSKKLKTLVRSDSFRRYGISTPSFEQLLADKEKINEHLKETQTLSALNCTVLNCTNSLVKKSTHEQNAVVLDCMKMTNDELKHEFLQYNAELSELLKYGEFKVQANIVKNNIHSDSTDFLSIMVFTEEQRLYLLSLLKQSFDEYNQIGDYIFNVLLPKLCLKIFMNLYDMTETKAISYMHQYVVTL